MSWRGSGLLGSISFFFFFLVSFFSSSSARTFLAEVILLRGKIFKWNQSNPIHRIESNRFEMKLNFRRHKRKLKIVTDYKVRTHSNTHLLLKPDLFIHFQTYFNHFLNFIFRQDTNGITDLWYRFSKLAKWISEKYLQKAFANWTI